MTINNEHTFGETVFFSNDMDQLEYIITGITVRKGYIIYLLSNSGNETSAYDYEITEDKRIF